MILKKINAALGLLSILFLLLHIIYNVYAYLTMYYNPFLQKVFAIPFMVLVCLHAICGMLTVMLKNDGSTLDLYPQQNLRTILQRVSAALIFPLLILHINTFSLMQACAKKDMKAGICLLILAELLFFAVVIIHVAVSLTKGLITLGLLTSRETMAVLDRIIYICGAIFYFAAVYAVVKGQVIMFLIG